MKVKLCARWGEYPPGRELNLPDDLAATLIAAKICRKVDELPFDAPPGGALETGEAPPAAETAARTGKPRRTRPAAAREANP